MSVEIVQLLVDFGMVVLIWIVQLIIYPSFLYYDARNLDIWHSQYTARFMFIVMPLMLVQLGIAIYQFILSIELFTLIHLALVGLLWASTFLQFIPMHSKISSGEGSRVLLNSLVSKNWGRTFLWTLLFVLSFSHYFLMRL